MEEDDEDVTIIRPLNKNNSRKARNMVYANKQERQQEKQVVSYMLDKVLNHRIQTKVVGISTKASVEKYGENKRVREIHALKKD